MVAGVFSVRDHEHRRAEPPSDSFIRNLPRRPVMSAWRSPVAAPRALTAGMGQLRALNQLTMNGRPLLAQIKALSNVPGGAWLACHSSIFRPGRRVTKLTLAL